MSQEYLYAVERAELLGETPPSEEEWAARKVEIEIKEDDVNDTVAQELNTADETATRVGGGLDELNSILSATQKKINRFKTVCGSLGTLLKVRVSSRDNTPVHKPSADGPHEDSQFQEQTLTLEASHDDHLEASVLESKPVVHKKIDINEKMSSHLDKLDSMITKAERAEGSMQHQTKIMKKIISK